jgi:flagellar assembly factor FliW
MHNRGDSMEISTKACGKIELNPDNVLTFEWGVFGFEGLSKFVLLGKPDDVLFWLQSVEKEEVAFVVINPQLVIPDYQPEISIDDLRYLDADENSLDLLVYAIVVVPEEVKKMTANLKAPIIINAKNNTAKQIVLNDDKYKIKEPVFRDK